MGMRECTQERACRLRRTAPRISAADTGGVGLVLLLPKSAHFRGGQAQSSLNQRIFAPSLALAGAQPQHKHRAAADDVRGTRRPSPDTARPGRRRALIQGARPPLVDDSLAGARRVALNQGDATGAPRPKTVRCAESGSQFAAKPGWARHSSGRCALIQGDFVARGARCPCFGCPQGAVDAPGCPRRCRETAALKQGSAPWLSALKQGAGCADSGSTVRWPRESVRRKPKRGVGFRSAL